MLHDNLKIKNDLKTNDKYKKKNHFLSKIKFLKVYLSDKLSKENIPSSVVLKAVEESSEVFDYFINCRLAGILMIFKKEKDFQWLMEFKVIDKSYEIGSMYNLINYYKTSEPNYKENRVFNLTNIYINGMNEMIIGNYKAKETYH